MRRQVDTKNQIIMRAQKHLQHAGFNSLSFQMIADDLGIRKPSLYHHFASKEELGLVVIQQYALWFDKWKIKVQDLDPKEQLHQYFVIFEKFSKDDAKLCPIGALSIDINSLPPAMKKSLKALCENHCDWLRGTLKTLVKQGKLKPQLELKALTELIMSTLQGALLISRIKQNGSTFAQIRKNLEDLLGVRHGR